ncbi:hypothetical protein Tco_0368567 [Tanacetum coccineum]
MIQVKEMIQDTDLKHSKSKDEDSRSRSLSIKEQSHYIQVKTKIRPKKEKIKRYIFNTGKDKVKLCQDNLHQERQRWGDQRRPQHWRRFPPPTKLSTLVDDDVGEEEAIEINTKVVNTNNEEHESIEVDIIVNIKEPKNHPLEQVIVHQRDVKEFELEDSKPTKTPMSTDINLTKDDDADSVDSTIERSCKGDMVVYGGRIGDVEGVCGGLWAATALGTKDGHVASNLTKEWYKELSKLL